MLAEGTLGDFPTPVWSATDLQTVRGALWIKNDGASHPLYGGNKVRKLGPILDDAVACGARRIVTMGGAGSHHVLATTVFAARRSLPTLAVLGPQPWSAHAERTLRCGLAWGLEAIAAESMARIPVVTGRAWRRGDYVIPVGAWGRRGTEGYVQAGEELAEQVRAGLLPEPDWIVVALGSGGTAAGLLTGVLRAGLRSRILAVSVAVRSQVAARSLVLPLAWAAARSLGSFISWRELSQRLVVTSAYLGSTYGAATPEGVRATHRAREVGLELDPTYTAKAFAAALDLIETRPSANRPTISAGEIPRGKSPDQGLLQVVYWHTLSTVSLDVLSEAAGDEPRLPDHLRTLLRGGERPRIV